MCNLSKKVGQESRSQFERNYLPELYKLMRSLELVRADLMMGCDDFEGDNSTASDVINQAIIDVYLAIESSCGVVAVHRTLHKKNQEWGQR